MKFVVALDFQFQHGVLLQELVAATPSSRDWAGIFISILVILSIIGMVALVVRVLPQHNPESLNLNRISIDDIVGGGFTPNMINATWLNGKFFSYFSIFMLL